MMKKVKVKLKLSMYLGMTMNVREGKTSAFISSALNGGEWSILNQAMGRRSQYSLGKELHRPELV
jgi:hypothetical protein